MEIKLDTVKSQDRIYEPSLSKRSYLSTQHLWAAKHFKDLVGKRELKLLEEQKQFDGDHRAYVIACIFSSVAFLDAAIHEVYKDCFEGHLGYVDGLPETVRDELKKCWVKKKGCGSMLKKHKFALRVSARPEFDDTKEPYKDVDVLVDVRNALMHYEPGKRDAGGPDKEEPDPRDFDTLESVLRNRFPENELTKKTKDPFFPDKAPSRLSDSQNCPRLELLRFLTRSF